MYLIRATWTIPTPTWKAFTRFWTKDLMVLKFLTFTELEESMIIARSALLMLHLLLQVRSASLHKWLVQQHLHTSFSSSPLHCVGKKA